MKHFFPILLSALFALPAAQAAPNDLACNLYARLKSRQGRPGNIFFSPLGVSTVLGMAALGAKGATAEELDTFLRLPAIERQDLQDALDACQAPASPVDLVPALRAMGLETVFSPGADFSDITGARDLQPDMVIHKAFIEVAEEGTEAAAATAMGFKALGGRPAPEPPPVVFRADRPFLFAILENSTRTILFLGRLDNPATP